MPALTNPGEIRMLNWLTGNTPATPPALPLTLALLTAEATESSTGVEVDGAGYHRPNIVFIPALLVASQTQTANDSFIRIENMPECDTDGVVQGDVVGFNIYDSTGFRWMYGKFAKPRKFIAGDPAEINTNKFVITGD